MAASDDEGNTPVVDTQKQSPRYYHLRTYPDPRYPTPDSAAYSGLFLRLHGSGTNSVMLVPTPPIYLRVHFEPDDAGAVEVTPLVQATESVVRRQIITSHAERHVGRSWGLVLSTDPRDSKALAGWHRAEILDDSGQTGWTFEPLDGNGQVASRKAGAGSDEDQALTEQLVWKGGDIRASSSAPVDETYEWAGWMACKGPYGHLQLFWLTDKMKEDGLPKGCQRVVVVRKWLYNPV